MNRWLTAGRPRPLIIGHRGASHAAPENTLAAMRLALLEQADGVEFDVQLSADGIPVVIHDHILDRTTTGHGRIDQLTAAEMSRLDAGAGEAIPTLEAILAEFGSKLLYNIELKDFSWGNQPLAPAVAALIRKYELAEQVTVSSFNPLTMRRARRCMPSEVLLAQLRYTGLQQYSYLLFSGEADHPHYSMVDNRYISWAVRRRYRVHVWTVDDTEEARRLADLGVHALITNNPAAILTCFEKK